MSLAGRWGAKFKMSDWEDEYDGDGVAIQKSVTKPAPTEWKLPSSDSQRESVSFGVRNGPRFGGLRQERGDRSGGGSEYRSRRGGGEGRQPPRSTERRTFSDEKSDFSPPVTFTVENASIGRVIGRFLKR